MILLMMQPRPRRLLPLFVLSRAKCGLQPIRHGEEKLSRGCSSTGLGDAVQSIPMPWNWIFPPTVRILLRRSLTMA